MAVIETVGIVALDTGDIDAGLALSDEANWNQTADDWASFLSHGRVFGCRDPSGRLVATGALLPYPSAAALRVTPVAWVSMVLVTARWRRKGLATRLVDRCLQSAAELGVTPWLDATAAGATVYRPMGFATRLSFHRLLLASRAGASAVAADAALAPSDTLVETLIDRDARVTGLRRSELFCAMCRRPGSQLHVQGDALCLVRAGRRLWHIGPVYAAQEDDAARLIEHVAATMPGPFLIDVNDACGGLRERLTAAGWKHERSYERMRHGSVTAPGVADTPQPSETPVAFTGPEFG